MTVTNSGAAAPADRPSPPTGRPFASDIYRVSVSVDGAGWEADVQNALVAVKAGESIDVPVHVAVTRGHTHGAGESHGRRGVGERSGANGRGLHGRVLFQ